MVKTHFGLTAYENGLTVSGSEWNFKDLRGNKAHGMVSQSGDSVIVECHAATAAVCLYALQDAIKRTFRRIADHAIEAEGMASFVI